MDPDRFRSAIEMYGVCGGRRAGAYVFDGVLAGAVGLGGLLVAPFRGASGDSTLPYRVFASVLLLWLRTLELMLFIGGRGSSDPGCGVAWVSTVR